MLTNTCSQIHGILWKTARIRGGGSNSQPPRWWLKI